MLTSAFFDREPLVVAQDLIGKVIFRRYQNIWLTVQIIEAEAYYLEDKGSHASLGYTEKRQALFMPAGTIYMYYARGGDSLNVSCRGKGNAILIKSGVPYITKDTAPNMLSTMQKLNPTKSGALREPMRLCSGQTLLCKSLSIRVPEWDKKQFTLEEFYSADVGYQPHHLIQTTRVGIPKGRDEELPYRFIDQTYVQFCSKPPNRSNMTVLTV